MTDRLMTAKDLADRWQVPKSQVYRLAREGRIPAVRLGRYWRFRLDLIEQWERVALGPLLTDSIPPAPIPVPGMQ
jgi:excisionase family DNA binding protein